MNGNSYDVGLNGDYRHCPWTLLWMTLRCYTQILWHRQIWPRMALKSQKSRPYFLTWNMLQSFYWKYFANGARCEAGPHAGLIFMRLWSVQSDLTLDYVEGLKIKVIYFLTLNISTALRNTLVDWGFMAFTLDDLEGLKVNVNFLILNVCTTVIVMTLERVVMTLTHI